MKIDYVVLLNDNSSVCNFLYHTFVQVLGYDTAILVDTQPGDEEEYRHPTFLRRAKDCLDLACTKKKISIVTAITVALPTDCGQFDDHTSLSLWVDYVLAFRKKYQDTFVPDWELNYAHLWQLGDTHLSMLTSQTNVLPDYNSNLVVSTKNFGPFKSSAPCDKNFTLT